MFFFSMAFPPFLATGLKISFCSKKIEIKSISKEREKKITKYIFMLQTIQKSVTIHVTSPVIDKVLFFRMYHSKINYINSFV